LPQAVARRTDGSPPSTAGWPWPAVAARWCLATWAPPRRPAGRQGGLDPGVVALVIAAGSPRRTRLEARPAGRAPARPWRDEPRAPPRHRSGGMAGARAMAKALAQASGLPVVLAPSLCGAPGGWGNELLMTGLERLNVLSTPALYRPEVALEDHPVEHGQAAHHALTMDGLDARHGTPPAPTPVDVWSRLVEDGRGGQHRVGRDGSPSPAVDCGRRHLTPTRRQRTNGHLCAGVTDRTSREQGPAARCSSRRWTGRRPQTPSPGDPSAKIPGPPVFIVGWAQGRSRCEQGQRRLSWASGCPAP
jgi:hypothetical protein